MKETVYSCTNEFYFDDIDDAVEDYFLDNCIVFGENREAIIDIYEAEPIYSKFDDTRTVDCVIEYYMESLNEIETNDSDYLLDNFCTAEQNELEERLRPVLEKAHKIVDKWLTEKKATYTVINTIKNKVKVKLYDDVDLIEDISYVD